MARPAPSPLPAVSPMLTTLRHLSEREGLSSIFKHIGRSPYLPMPDDWASYLKRKIRKAERLKADGELELVT